MYCTKCGFKNNNDSKFCASCGEKIIAVSENTENQLPDIPVNSPAPYIPQNSPIQNTPPGGVMVSPRQDRSQVPKKKKLTIILVLIMIAVLTIIAAVLVVSSLRNNGENEGKHGYNDSYKDITYTGSWKHVVSDGYINNDQHYTATAGDSCEYTFKGTAIEWIGVKNVDLGKADVYVDGILQATVDQYASSWLKQQTLFMLDNLKGKQHTIKIVVKSPEDKNSSSKGNITAIDAFYVYTGSSGAEKKVIVTGPVNTRGNTIGNLANTGLVAQQGDWIYYRNTALNNKLCKIKTDDTGKVKLTDDEVYYINVIGNWVYYVNGSDKGKAYKVRTDGTERTKLNDDECKSMTVTDGWIYYVNITDNSTLYKIKTDGSNRTKLNDAQSTFPIPMDGWIYYINKSHGTKVYKIKVDGTGDTVLCDKGGASCLNLADSTLYFNNEWGSLYKVGTDGSSYQMFSDGGIDGVYTKYYKTIHTLNIENGSIYFSNMKLSSMDLGMMQVSQQNWTKLHNQDWVTNINLAGDRIYFTDQVGTLYRIKKNGEGYAAVE